MNQQFPDPVEHGMRSGARVVLQRLAIDDEWDQAPQVCAVTHGDLLTGDRMIDDLVPPEYREVVVEGHDATLAAAFPMTFTPLPVPPWLWSMAEDTASALAILTRTFNEHDLPPAPRLLGLPSSDRLMGLIFIAEAWSIDPRTASVPIDEGAFDTHPDRVEVRTATGVDMAGEVYGAVQVRGEDEIVEFPPHDPDSGVAGAVPMALHRLLAAIAGEPTTEMLEDDT